MITKEYLVILDTKTNMQLKLKALMLCNLVFYPSNRITNDNNHSHS